MVLTTCTPQQKEEGGPGRAPKVKGQEPPEKLQTKDPVSQVPNNHPARGRAPSVCKSGSDLVNTVVTITVWIKV